MVLKLVTKPLSVRMRQSEGRHNLVALMAALCTGNICNAVRCDASLIGPKSLIISCLFVLVHFCATQRETSKNGLKIPVSHRESGSGICQVAGKGKQLEEL